MTNLCCDFFWNKFTMEPGNAVRSIESEWKHTSAEDLQENLRAELSRCLHTPLYLPTDPPSADNPYHRHRYPHHLTRHHSLSSGACDARLPSKSLPTIFPLPHSAANSSVDDLHLYQAIVNALPPGFARAAHDARRNTCPCLPSPLLKDAAARAENGKSEETASDDESTGEEDPTPPSQSSSGSSSRSKETQLHGTESTDTQKVKPNGELKMDYVRTPAMDRNGVHGMEANSSDMGDTNCTRTLANTGTQKMEPSGTHPPKPNSREKMGPNGTYGAWLDSTHKVEANGNVEDHDRITRWSQSSQSGQGQNQFRPLYTAARWGKHSPRKKLEAGVRRVSEGDATSQRGSSTSNDMTRRRSCTEDTAYTARWVAETQLPAPVFRPPVFAESWPERHSVMTLPYGATFPPASPSLPGRAFPPNSPCASAQNLRDIFSHTSIGNSPLQSLNSSLQSLDDLQVSPYTAKHADRRATGIGAGTAIPANHLSAGASWSGSGDRWPSASTSTPSGGAQLGKNKSESSARRKRVRLGEKKRVTFAGNDNQVAGNENKVVAVTESSSALNVCSSAASAENARSATPPSAEISSSKSASIQNHGVSSTASAQIRPVPLPSVFQTPDSRDELDTGVVCNAAISSTTPDTLSVQQQTAGLSDKMSDTLNGNSLQNTGVCSSNEKRDSDAPHSQDWSLMQVQHMLSNNVYYAAQFPQHCNGQQAPFSGPVTAPFPTSTTAAFTGHTAALFSGLRTGPYPLHPTHSFSSLPGDLCGAYFVQLPITPYSALPAGSFPAPLNTCFSSQCSDSCYGSGASQCSAVQGRGMRRSGPEAADTLRVQKTSRSFSEPCVASDISMASEISMVSELSVASELSVTSEPCAALNPSSSNTITPYSTHPANPNPVVNPFDLNSTHSTCSPAPQPTMLSPDGSDQSAGQGTASSGEPFASEASPENSSEQSAGQLSGQDEDNGLDPASFAPLGKALFNLLTQNTSELSSCKVCEDYADSAEMPQDPTAAFEWATRAHVLAMTAVSSAEESWKSLRDFVACKSRRFYSCGNGFPWLQEICQLISEDSEPKSKEQMSRRSVEISKSGLNGKNTESRSNGKSPESRPAGENPQLTLKGESSGSMSDSEYSESRSHNGGSLSRSSSEQVYIPVKQGQMKDMTEDFLLFTVAMTTAFATQPRV